MNSVQFQGCRRTGGHKSTVWWKIHFKEIFFGGFKLIFSPKWLEDELNAQEYSSSCFKWKGRCRDWRPALQGVSSSSWRWQVSSPRAAHEGKASRTQHKPCLMGWDRQGLGNKCNNSLNFLKVGWWLMEGFQNLPGWVVDPLQCQPQPRWDLCRSWVAPLLCPGPGVGAKTSTHPNLSLLLPQDSPVQ